MDDAFHVDVYWYDGHSALRHAGHATWDGANTLTLHNAAGGAVDIPFADLRFVERLPTGMVYGRISEPNFRLTLPAAIPAGLERYLPAEEKYGGWVDRIGLGKAAVGFGVVSAVAVAVFLTAPNWLGPMVPEPWERQIGDAMVGDLGNRVCSTPQSDAAMAKLLAKVDPAQEKVRAGIANVDMVNAVALPGGQVLLFDGLVQDAESPEELAGVLGHEVGHVRERHVMTAMLRQFGLSILLAGANSGLGDGLLSIASLGYSRDAEREADEYARARMAQADISPLGAAGFFERMAKESGETLPAENKEGKAADSSQGNTDDVIGWIATHPSSGERAVAYRNSAKPNHTYPATLTDQEFQALKSACANDPDVEEFDLF